MEKLEGQQRKTFLENAGRQAAGTGYHHNFNEAFEKFRSFVPLQFLQVGKREWTDFRRGFQEVQDLRILIMHTKAKAQQDNSFILKELEGKGLTFLKERVK